MILAGVLLAAAPLAALAAQDWNLTRVQTEQGHRVGNPEADVKLIAFSSYSCPHCAHFEEDSDAALRMAYIHTGKLAFEMRHVIRNPLDLAAALVTECGPENKFWANHRAILRDQERWLKIAVDATPAQSQRWMAGSLPARMRNIAADLDFYELMAPRGYTIAQLDRCLSDEAAARAIMARGEVDRARFDIPGTPSFALNGAMLEGVHNWADLQPAIEAAGTPKR